MTGPDSDNELDDFLARRSVMHWRFGESDSSEPPAELDRIVLAKAREAIKRPSETPVYRSPQWALPVGLAASLLLVFAVVLNFAHVTNRQGAQIAATELAAPEAPPAANARERLAQAELPAPASSALTDAKTESYAPAPPALASRNAQSMMKRSAESPARVEQQATAAASSLARNARAQRRDADASGAAAPPPGLTVEARAKDDFIASTDKPAEIDASRGLAGAAAGVMQNSAVDVARSGAAASEAASEPAQPGSSAATSDSRLLASNASPRPTADGPERSDAAKESYESVVTMASSSGSEGARRVRGGVKRAAPPNAPTPVELEKRKHPDPDAWLREIEELRSAGRVEDADRELAMFRRTYPDHSAQVPAEPSPPAK